MAKDYFLQPVILSAGSGMRLWPLSRESLPKQYIKLNSTSKYSLLQQTQMILKGFQNIENPIIICNEQQRFIVAEQMREINIKPKSIILEPFGKNTASAIAISSLLASKNNNDPILLILSSDHKIQNLSIFKKIIKAGFKEAKNN